MILGMETVMAIGKCIDNFGEDKKYSSLCVELMERIPTY